MILQEQTKTYVHFVSNSNARLIGVDEVVEIIPMVMLDDAKTVKNDSKFRGLFNYRGKIIPVFHVSAEMCGKPLDANHFLIVTSVGEKSVAIVATEVNELVSIPHDNISHIDPVGEQSFSVAKVNEFMLRIVHTVDFLQ